MNYEIILIMTAAVMGGVIIFGVFNAVRRAFLVPEGYAGLLYRKGRHVKTLSPGRHVRWGRHYTITVHDVRKASMPVVGQEVLTADNVAVKLSLFVTYQVTDPARAAHETQSWQTDIYNAAQLAVRAVVSSIAIEGLLGRRHEIAVQLLALVKPYVEPIGVTVHAVEVKDVMVSADLKRAFADVLKAKQEGQAALERARGESAALRNLANAARLMEGNPALMNLRLMQSLVTAQNAGNTLVLGVPGGFVPLKTAAKPTSNESDAAT